MEQKRKIRYIIVFLLLGGCVVLLCVLNICIGSVSITVFDILASIQGKKAYVTQVRGIEEARIWDNFEEWFREKLQESAPKSLSPEAESMAYLEKHPDTVIICDEVGNGIVPLDSFEREYRERLGRLLCEIAAKAERVERIVCGIGQRIK